MLVFEKYNFKWWTFTNNPGDTKNPVSTLKSSSTRSGASSLSHNIVTSKLPSSAPIKEMVESVSMISSIFSEVIAIWWRCRTAHQRGEKRQNQQRFHEQRSPSSKLWHTSQYRSHVKERKRRKLSRWNSWRKLIPYIIFYSVDAFVALGGKADKSGYVSKSSLMEIVKR